MGFIDWVKNRGQEPQASETKAPEQKAAPEKAVEKSVDVAGSLRPDQKQHVQEAAALFEKGALSASAGDPKPSAPTGGDAPKVAVEAGKDVPTGGSLSPSSTPSIPRDRGRGMER